LPDCSSICSRGNAGRDERIIHEINGPAERRYVSPYNLSRAFAASRDTEQVFAWLEKAHEEHNPDLIELRTEPVFDSVREDPRFADLLRRVGSQASW
jgi:hypothetical protein